MSKKMYTVADIAKITGYNRSTVTRWFDKQKIKKAHKLGFFSS
ncbi:DNA-binding protein [Lactobacillus helveticus]|nr:helix-turn-helix domain-containing protein [Lactobacillus helveticus]MBW7985284.1 DNA-binding protein [Lactobacillus helveticus]MBW8036777.1 DNA-binding protein [Lactobacillus helveticus]